MPSQEKLLAFIAACQELIEAQKVYIQILEERLLEYAGLPDD